jgi:hypothetical protein
VADGLGCGARAQRWFGFERTGADGVVLLSGASWGATGSGS